MEGGLGCWVVEGGICWVLNGEGRGERGERGGGEGGMGVEVILLPEENSERMGMLYFVFFLIKESVMGVWEGEGDERG